ncbi:MAG: PEGA domain-containing protein [Kofleriaceae bacterium]
MRVPLLVVIVVLTVLGVVAASARVASADDREVARTEFAAGQQADKDKDYAGAIEHYLRANELVPHPFAVYNIAADYERLGQLREAARWYQQFITTAPSGPERDKVMRLVPELQQRPSSLSVRSIPAGARVVIDGRAAGPTPVQVTLPGGAHHVSIERGGDRDERDVTLEYGEPGDVVFTLSGTPGSLYVFGTPAGADVAVDNITVGAVPATVALAAGPHTVRVSAPGYAPYETGTVVEPNATAQVEVRLQRDLGAIDAQTTPKLPVSYAVGAAGGADVQKGDPLVLAVVGLRLSQYEGELRLGHAGGGTELGLLFHWYVLPTMVTPYLSAGYSWGGIGFGYTINGGLRWDLARGAHTGFALLADLGLRTYSGTDTMGSTVSGVTFPLELTAEVTFR